MSNTPVFFCGKQFHNKNLFYVLMWIFRYVYLVIYMWSRNVIYPNIFFLLALLLFRWQLYIHMYVCYSSAISVFSTIEQLLGEKRTLAKILSDISKFEDLVRGYCRQTDGHKSTQLVTFWVLRGNLLYSVQGLKFLVFEKCSFPKYTYFNLQKMQTFW